ncbi:MAG: WbqC family protein [Rhodospirillales bacterium]
MPELDLSTEAVCAIHQPNFFPWLGYFDKVRRADVFVILDLVGYPKSGHSGMGSWLNRVALNINGEGRRVRCPLVRKHGFLPVREVMIDDSKPWRKKLLKTIESSYKKSPNYLKALDLLEPLILYDTPNLMEFNLNAIHRINKAMGISSNFVYQSELGVTGTRTQLLIDILQSFGITNYMCGGGAGGYQEDHLFEEANINLIYQNFTPKPYGDPKRFLPGLSVIDFLMWADDWQE